MKTTFQTIGAVFAAGIFAVAMGAPATARPGTVNYVEGNVTLDGRVLGAKSQGSSEVEAGHVLRTGQGKVEMLLTPGVFLRLNDHSAVRMVSPSLTDTRVELLQGEAMVEADEVLPANRLVVADHGVDTQIQKHGVYQFTADPPRVAVYDGKAQVVEDDHAKEIGKGKELAFAQNGAMKLQSFDRHQADSLYQWSSVRSEYLSEANQSSVQTIIAGYPWGWYDAGWFWNPWFDTWAFVPGDGLFYSPFGFGFYSPVYWQYYPPARYYTRPGRIVTSSPRMGAPATGAPAMRGTIMRGPMGGPTMRAPMGGVMRGGAMGRRH